jgi:uncharacterized membrane protein
LDGYPFGMGASSVPLRAGTLPRSMGWLQFATLVLSVLGLGMGFVLYLICAELVEVGQICPYCTSVHVITFLLFSLIVFQASAPPGARQPRR